MSKVEIFVFRHGETDWNRQRRFQGHTDIPLNDFGREQARALIPVFAKHRPEVIVTSDLIRAHETAQIANSLAQAPIVVSESLRECGLGDLEGLHRDAVLETFGDEWQRWLSVHPDDADFCLPNGESKKAHLSRMVSFLKTFLLQHPQYKRIGLSTHGGSLLRLVHHCADAPEHPVALPNCVIYRMSYDRNEDHWSFHGVPE